MLSINASAPTGAPDPLAGGGAIGTLMRGHDWSATSLGPAAAWPSPLRTLVGVMLAAGQPMFIAWGPGRVLLYNDAYATLMGDRHPTALGRPFFDVWPDIVDDCVPLFARVFAGEPVHMDDIELRPERPGRPREAHFAFSYTPVRDEAGAVAGLFCVCSETTEQVFACRREAAQAERQRVLFQRMPGFVGVLSGPDHVYEYVNDAYVALSGPRDFIGRSVREVFPDLTGQGFHELLDQVYATGEAFKACNVPLRLAQEEHERFIDHMYQPVRNEAGEVAGTFVTGYEVTERVRAEAAEAEAAASLRDLNATLEARVAERTAERDLFATIVERTDVMIMACGLDYTILALNRANSDAFESAYGVRPKVGDNMLDLLAGQPEHQAAVREGWGRGLAGEEVTFVEAYGDPGRSRAFYEVSFRNLHDGRGERIGCYQFVTDVTERLKREAELAQAHEQLRQSQKMEAVGQLTGGLAHDFNNLLAGISGSLELMAKRIEQGRAGEVGRYIAAAQEAAERAAALTHRLLAFSRRQTLAPKVTDVAALVLGMEDMIRRTVGPEIAVEVFLGLDVWPVEVDANQLENALLNLCINARDAMPEGGIITIETTNRPLDVQAARQRDLPAGQYVSLSVSDSGTGMAAEVAARAFEPFFTTKPLGLGTGLGLSMVYGFMRQSGGQVRIHSQEGQGTTVGLYLLRHQGEDVADAPASVQASTDAGFAGDGETVLVIDDEPVVRMLVAEVLRERGYVVLEAQDGPEGLRVLRSKARVDLLVTDVGLPGGLNGRQVADAARVLRPGLRVLFVTGYAEAAVLSHGHLDAGMEVVTKPFGVDEIGRRVGALMIGDLGPAS